MVGHCDPCSTELVNYVLEGIKRICYDNPKKKKHSINYYHSTTTPHIIQIIKQRKYEFTKS